MSRTVHLEDEMKIHEEEELNKKEEVRKNTDKPIQQTWETIKEKGSDYAQALKDKSNAFADNMQKNAAVQEISEVAKKHPQQAIIGALIVVGFLCSFFWWFGGLLVGIAAGLYSPWDLRSFWSRIVRYYETKGVFSSCMLGIATLFLLINVFSFIIGGLIGMGIKVFFPKQFA